MLSARKLVSKKSWGEKWILRLHYNLKSIINTKGKKKKERIETNHKAPTLCCCGVLVRAEWLSKGEAV